MKASRRISFFKRSVFRLVLPLMMISSMAIASAEAKQADSREVIWLNAEEKSALLAEMRNFLIASQAILEASLADDMETVETVARSVGIKALKGTPKAILKKLPAGFIEIGPKAHLGFESIADEASGMGEREVIMNTLATLQKNCITCHATYQFEVK